MEPLPGEAFDEFGWCGVDVVEFAVAAPDGGDNGGQLQVGGEVGEEPVDHVGERAQFGWQSAYLSWRDATLVGWRRGTAIEVHRGCLLSGRLPY